MQKFYNVKLTNTALLNKCYTTLNWSPTAKPDCYIVYYEYCYSLTPPISTVMHKLLLESLKEHHVLQMI